MNINKGGSTLNYLFGAFLLLNAVTLGVDLYERYRNSKVSEKKGCGGCGKK